MFLPYKKATLLIPSGPPDDPERKHLFVILSDPTPWKECNGCYSNLIVPISSIKKGVFYDKTCMINIGEHPFIKKESFVLYRYCRIEKTEKILNGVNKKVLIPFSPINSFLFDRIYKGLFVSRFVPEKIFDFLDGK